MLRFSVNTCQSILKTNFPRINIRCRSIHVACRQRRSILQNVRIFDCYRQDSKVLTALFIRHASTDDAQAQVVGSANEAVLTRIEVPGHSELPQLPQLPINQLPEIPDPPSIPEIIEQLPKIHPNGEIAFESLGLGGYTPIGLIQNALEWLHISANFPWWGTIVIATLIGRLAMFPLVINTQRHAAEMAKYMPLVQEKQQLLTEARQCGDHYQSAIYANELYVLMKEKGLSPFKSMRTALIQAPLFISFFLSLREMANLPVESFKTGGLWWFTDLTLPDPYYILPVVMGITLVAIIEVGTDTAALHTSMGNAKYMLRCAPIIVVPLALSFPSAILCYWTMTNFFSLLQVAVLRIPYVRQTLKLPAKVKPVSTMTGKKPFLKGLKESWENMKVTKQFADRERSDSMQFQSAARAPIVKTYKFNPTKQDKKTTVYAKNNK